MNATFVEMFGFDASGNAVARGVEQHLVSRRLRELAARWGTAHDDIQEIRAKYEGDCSASSEEALADQKRLLDLDKERRETGSIFAEATKLAMQYGFTLNSEDIRNWYKPGVVAIAGK